jgi:hypothetical protein
VACINFDGAIPQTYKICLCPSRTKVVGELVKIDWNLLSGTASLDELSDLICLELTPFIIGVGHVIAEKLAECRIIIRRDERKDFNVHGASSTAKTAWPVR